MGKPRFFNRWITPGLIALLLVIGTWSTIWYGQENDAAQRAELMAHASALAHTIDVERSKTLAFSADDRDKPEFRLLAGQMKAYAEANGLMGIYSMAIRDGRIYFGPETYAPDDPLASPPGALYQKPPQEIWESFRSRLPKTMGPYKDEYGEFVSGLGPVFNAQTGEVIMVIGVDREVKDWHSAINRARLLPLTATLLMTALVLAVSFVLRVGKRRPGEKQRRLRHVEAILCAMVGLAISLALAWRIQLAGKNLRQETFSSLARAEVSSITYSLRNAGTQVETLRHFFESGDNVTQDEFHRFTQGLIENGQAQAWEWIPVVPRESLAGFEKEARRLVRPNYLVFQKDAEAHDWPVSDRVNYYPVYFAEPHASNEKALGYDLGSEPLQRAALIKAERSGFPTASDAIRLVQETGSQKSMLVFQPVYATANGHRTLRGFALVVLRLSRTLQQALHESSNEQLGISVALYQLEAGLPPSLMATDKEEQTPSDLTGSIKFGNQTLTLVQPLFLFGKTYAIQVKADPAYLAAHPVHQGWFVGLTGLVLTSLLTGFVVVLVNHRTALLNAVEERTRQLRQSEEAYRRQFSENSAVELLIDPKSGNIIDANAAASRFYGYPRHQLLKLRIFDLSLRPEQEVRADAEKTPKGQGSRFESRQRLADGSVREVEIFLSRIHFAEQETLHVIVIDISARKQAERDLRKLTLAIEQSPASIVITDLTGQIEYVNPFFTSVTGYSLDEARGQNPRLLKSGETSAEVYTNMWETIASGKVWRGELSNRKKNGELFIEYAVISPLIGANGQTTHYVAIKEDITARKQTEASLKIREQEVHSLNERLSLAVDSAGIGVWDWLVSENKLIWDEQMYKLYGIKAEQFTNAYDAWTHSLHSDDLARGNAEIQLALRGEKQFNTAFRVVWPSGEIHHIRAFARVERDPSGKPLRMTGINYDITERIHTEAERTELSQRLSFAMDATGDGIWDWDITSGNVKHNARWCQILGLNDSFLEHPLELFAAKIHPDDRPKVMAAIQTCLEGRGPYTSRHRIRHADGYYLWVMDRGKVVARDATDQPTRMVGSMADITHQKYAEDALRESQEELNRYFTSSLDLLCIADADGHFVRLNPEWENVLGYPVSELEGNSFLDYVHPDDMPDTLAALSRLEGKAAVNNFENRYRCKDGSYRWLEWRSKPQGTKVYAIARDITRRKHAEEKLQDTNRYLEEASLKAELANAAKSEFLANMSHEIRTPMNGVIGMIGLMLNTELTESQRRCALTVRNSAQTLLQLINDILDFSKIEAGKLELETIDFDLQNLLDDFSELMTVRAAEKNLEFICAAAPDMPTLLRGDPGRLRQILTNLTGNAIKFTSEGEVVVRVSLELQSEEQVLLRFAIRDTGIGIPNSKLGLLFEKFSQVDSSITRKFGGTGLGLAISKQLAEMMGGSIGVASEEGRGSVFWFTVCLAIQPNQQPLTTGKADLGGVHVLVVDDNATNREILCDQLVHWGMLPTTASDGATALQLLQHAFETGEDFHLALIDQKMPIMDGPALCRAIRADSRLQKTHLVMLTSQDVRSSSQWEKEIGIAACLVKPVRKSELQDCLATTIAGGIPKHSERTSSQHPLRVKNAERVRILLVEDNSTNQQVALGMLGQLGLTADAVANGQEALQVLTDFPYDLVFMDVQMPIMDGLEATRRIRDAKTSVRNHQIPIVAMTAHAFARDQEYCMTAGMNDYITKPVEPHDLARVLEKWLPADPDQKPNALNNQPIDTKTDTGNSNPRIFNRAALLARLMHKEALLKRVQDVFLADMPAKIQALSDAVARGDLQDAFTQAHTIKGAAGNINSEAFLEIATLMENTAAARELPPLKKQLPELLNQFKLLKQAIVGQQ